MVVLGLILVLGVLVGGYTVMGSFCLRAGHRRQPCVPRADRADVGRRRLRPRRPHPAAPGARRPRHALRRPQVHQAPGRAAPPAPVEAEVAGPPVRRGPAQRHRDHRGPPPRSPGATPPVTPAARRTVPTAPDDGDLYRGSSSGTGSETRDLADTRPRRRVRGRPGRPLPPTTTPPTTPGAPTAPEAPAAAAGRPHPPCSRTPPTRRRLTVHRAGAGGGPERTAPEDDEVPADGATHDGLGRGPGSRHGEPRHGRHGAPQRAAAAGSPRTTPGRPPPAPVRGAVRPGTGRRDLPERPGHRAGPRRPPPAPTP